jgi:acyl-coenzyme A thioesterase PaaI-like protein
MGGACYNISKGKTGYTLQFSIQYLRICKTNRWIFTHVTRQGGTGAHLQLKATARVNSEEGNLIAEAQGTFMISKNDAKK